jgi:hypothetical protein
MKTCELRDYICIICFEQNKHFSAKKKDFLMHLIDTHESQLLEVNEKFPLPKENPEEVANKHRNTIDKIFEGYKNEMRDTDFISGLGGLVNDYPSDEDDIY